PLLKAHVAFSKRYAYAGAHGTDCASKQGGKVLREQSRRFKIETVLATLSGVLGVVTLFWHDWLEVTGWDPDRHNGSAEGLIAVLLIASVSTLPGGGRQ